MKKVSALKILLINPPDTRPPDMLAAKVRIGVVPPLGLAYIAANLEKQGVEVQIIDAVAQGQLEGVRYDNGEVRYGLADQQIEHQIRSFKPDMVGVSCLFSNKAYDAHNICRIVKLVDENIKTVMGGTHPSSVPEETLKDPNVNFVCCGEGEFWFDNYCDPAAGTMDLDSLPFPARHLLPMDVYLKGQSPHSGLKRAPATSISTSRGCPARCEFCAIRNTFGLPYRRRSVPNVISEVEHLIEKYSIRELHFEDDNLTANKKRALELCHALKPFDLTLNASSGLAVLNMDEELVEAMCSAGFYSLSFAIESGSEHILKLMHKKVDLQKASKLIRHARDLGMKTKAFYILGYPGETISTMQETIKTAVDLGADWSLFFPATPLPGTKMLERCKQNGWLADPNMDYRYYFFKPNIRTPGFTPEDVLIMRDEANSYCNFDNNINVREKKYARASEDFVDVLKLYPDLKIAQDALHQVQNC